MSEYTRRIIAGSLVAFVVAVSVGASIIYLSPSLNKTSSSSQGSSSSGLPSSRTSQFATSSSATTLNCALEPVEPSCATSTLASSEVRGLILQASLATKVMEAGSADQFNVSLYNILTTANNVPAANNWPLTNLTITPCGPVNSPLATVVVKGYYTSSNISSAPAIPYTMCTTVMGGVTEYSFQPSSDKATIVTQYCGGNCSAEEIGWSSSLTGYFASVNGYEPFTAGNYTVAVADEWGDMLVLNFEVLGSVPSYSVTCDVQDIAIFSISVVSLTNSTTYYSGGSTTYTTTVSTFTITTSVSESPGYETTSTYVAENQTYTGALSEWTQQACTYG